MFNRVRTTGAVMLAGLMGLGLLFSGSAEAAGKQGSLQAPAGGWKKSKSGYRPGEERRSDESRETKAKRYKKVRQGKPIARRYHPDPKGPPVQSRALDADGDGILNDKDRDVDNDGIPNDLDQDIDQDGVPNKRDRSPRNPLRS
jgi:hypothetical protein